MQQTHECSDGSQNILSVLQCGYAISGEYILFMK